MMIQLGHTSSQRDFLRGKKCLNKTVLVVTYLHSILPKKKKKKKYLHCKQFFQIQTL